MSARTCRGGIETSAGATGYIQLVSTRGDLPCRRLDPDLWFAESPADLEEAKSLCASCPIRARCLAAALDRREPWGVWGGEILEQGVVVARKRPRGRPRKTPAAACA
ncbi:WhiB family transcriptional regulator [Rhodococcus sp. HNM0569]|uniref:WhiB family transcriptional regulator n=1 Tax=Rhodococcus sp. HNM0569 TaxID=2716340 RepID=UPI00146CE32D|nr:WhiB family transcriptional regulator [Rhodococcus sp. HNM0569]NLU81977.1 WhiB family transcriptional regulator [Rhodococcus sp. HNM0569]